MVDLSTRRLWPRPLRNTGIGLDQGEDAEGARRQVEIGQRCLELAEDRRLRPPHLITDIGRQLGEIELALSRRPARLRPARRVGFSDAWTLDRRSPQPR
jgi:hypothetical protein